MDQWVKAQKTTSAGTQIHVNRKYRTWIKTTWNFIILLAPWRCGNKYKTICFKLNIQNSSMGTCNEICLRWMPQNLTNEKSTLIQVLAWCPKATNHYLSQCWPRTMMVSLCHNEFNHVHVFVLYIYLCELHKHKWYQQMRKLETNILWPLLLTWFNFNPSMDK